MKNILFVRDSHLSTTVSSIRFIPTFIQVASIGTSNVPVSISIVAIVLSIPMSYEIFEAVVVNI